MAIEFDKHVIKECPQCKAALNKSIAWLRKNPCPACGLKFDTTKFDKGEKEANDMIKDAFKKLR